MNNNDFMKALGILADEFCSFLCERHLKVKRQEMVNKMLTEREKHLLTMEDDETVILTEKVSNAYDREDQEY